MHPLLPLVESLCTAPARAEGKTPVKQLGLVSCASRVQLNQVSFYEPCLIMVLSGAKIIFEADEAITCHEGELLAVPGPSGYGLRNMPDDRTGRYRALIIPFKHADLERLRDLYSLGAGAKQMPARVFRFAREVVVEQAVRHYLESPEDQRLVSHRLLEILLILAGKQAGLLSYLLTQSQWSQRVRAVVSGDLAREWEVAEVCERLATSESTLRRNLKQEGTGFRDLLYDLRLNTALMQLLQTSQPIYRVADACGYQSVSRFASNFKKRFGLSPTEFRAAGDSALIGSERNLAVREHSPSY